LIILLLKTALPILDFSAGIFMGMIEIPHLIVRPLSIAAELLMQFLT